MYACNYNDNPAAEARRDAVAARRRAKGRKRLSVSVGGKK